MRSFLYYLYERRLLRQVRGRSVPRHLGIILDGNRRYALERGVADLREAYALAAGVLARTEAELRSAVAELGRSHRGSWRAEEKTAALAAWTLLRRGR